MENMNYNKKNIYIKIIKLDHVNHFFKLVIVLMDIDVNIYIKIKIKHLFHINQYNPLIFKIN